MKSIFAIFALVTATFAQRVGVASPNPGQNIPAGTSITVQVIETDGSSSETEIGIAVTLAHCQHNPCEDVSEDLGTIFYAGPYQPQFFNPPNAFGEQYQNFTVNIPSNFPKGPAVFSIPHASLVGAGTELFDEIGNVTINIV